MNIARMMEAGGHRAKGASLSGIGGVDSGADAAEFILLGSDTVQVRGAGERGGVAGCFVGRQSGGMTLLRPRASPPRLAAGNATVNRAAKTPHPPPRSAPV